MGRAEQTALVALDGDRDDSVALAVLVRVSLAQGRAQVAHDAARRLCCAQREQLAPNADAAYCAHYSPAALLARACIAMHMERETAAPLDDPITLTGEGVNDWLDAGHAAADAGWFDTAAQIFRHLLDHREVPAGAAAAAALGLVQVQRISDAHGADASRIRAGAARIERSPAATRDADSVADARFALACMADSLGDYESAARGWLRANSAVAAQPDLARHERLVEQIVATCNADLFARHRDAGLDDLRPVFIVGMPRSGTTLVEQALSAHSQVHAAGETPALRDLIPSLARHASGSAYPVALDRVPAKLFLELGERYLHALAAPATATRVTDKLPANFLLLGLAALALPRARVLHVRRDPLDTAISIFATRFAHGHEWAYSFETIARFQAQYQRLMAHWRSALPLPLHEVHYEDLVSDFETGVRSMLDFVGLDFEASCLAPHSTHRTIGTASNWQARQPVHRDSVGRAARYGPHLDGLAEALRAVGLIAPASAGIDHAGP